MNHQALSPLGAAPASNAAPALATDAAPIFAGSNTGSNNLNSKHAVDSALKGTSAGQLNASSQAPGIPPPPSFPANVNANVSTNVNVNISPISLLVKTQNQNTTSTPSGGNTMLQVSNDFTSGGNANNFNGGNVNNNNVFGSSSGNSAVWSQSSTRSAFSTRKIRVPASVKVQSNGDEEKEDTLRITGAKTNVNVHDGTKTRKTEAQYLRFKSKFRTLMHKREQDSYEEPEEDSDDYNEQQQQQQLHQQQLQQQQQVSRYAFLENLTTQKRDAAIREAERELKQQSDFDRLLTTENLSKLNGELTSEFSSMLSSSDSFYQNCFTFATKVAKVLSPTEEPWEDEQLLQLLYGVVIAGRHNNTTAACSAMHEMSADLKLMREKKRITQLRAEQEKISSSNFVHFKLTDDLKAVPQVQQYTTAGASFMAFPSTASDSSYESKLAELVSKPRAVLILSSVHSFTDLHPFMSREVSCRPGMKLVQHANNKLFVYGPNGSHLLLSGFAKDISKTSTPVDYFDISTTISPISNISTISTQSFQFEEEEQPAHTGKITFQLFGKDGKESSILREVAHRFQDAISISGRSVIRNVGKNIVDFTVEVALPSSVDQMTPSSLHRFVSSRLNAGWSASPSSSLSQFPLPHFVAMPRALFVTDEQRVSKATISLQRRVAEQQQLTTAAIAAICGTLREKNHWAVATGSGYDLFVCKSRSLAGKKTNPKLFTSDVEYFKSLATGGTPVVRRVFTDVLVFDKNKLKKNVNEPSKTKQDNSSSFLSVRAVNKESQPKVIAGLEKTAISMLNKEAASVSISPNATSVSTASHDSEKTEKTESQDADEAAASVAAPAAALSSISVVAYVDGILYVRVCGKNSISEGRRVGRSTDLIVTRVDSGAIPKL